MTHLFRGNSQGEILDASGRVVGRIVPVTDGDNAQDSGARVLHEVYALCEATGDECHGKDSDFNRGRAYEAKGIARGMGAWYQAEFCGATFRGEPSAAPADWSSVAVRVPERKAYSSGDGPTTRTMALAWNSALDAIMGAK